MGKQFWTGKRVLITGVCGTVGKELLRQVIEMGPDEIIGIDNNETELFFLGEKYRDRPAIRLFIGDIRDRDKMTRKTRGVDVILHSAAYKHVLLCEQSPRDAIQANIMGVQNIIDAALANDVSRVLFTSSDKAVNPTNVMGTSKLMGERLMTAANACQRSCSTTFVSTRFGNILGSRGSVIPLFKKQIDEGGPVTLTDRRMTRFIMTISEAVQLVLETTFMARGGEVFITKMPVISIADLAEVMVEELAPHFGRDPLEVEIKVTGAKPGEKLYEELMSEEEIGRAFELDSYFVVKPAFKNLYSSIDYLSSEMIGGVDKPYNSSVEEAMTKEELRIYLREHSLLDTEGTPCVY